MMKAAAFFFVSMGLLAIASAQDQPAKAEPEKKADPNIRPGGDLVLKFEHRIEIKETNRLNDDGVLILFPGDKVHLEFADDGKGGLVQPKVVAKVRVPERTITFEMKQDAELTSLSRSTKIQKTVAMDCVHRGLGGEEFHRTNLYPTEKGLMSFDSWPNTVWILRLSNFEVTAKPASEVYEERVDQGNEEKGGEKDDSAEAE